MAAPNVSGSAVLLIDLYGQLHSGRTMRSSTLKGLIIHTADDLGNPGHDYSYGWGLVNTKATADIISKDAIDENAFIMENYVDDTSTERNYIFNVDGSEEFKATVCWTDS